MTQSRQIIRQAELEARLDRQVEVNLIRAEIDDTARPIVVTPLREPDFEGCNWTVGFTQGGEVREPIVEAIIALRERFNIA